MNTISLILTGALLAASSPVALAESERFFSYPDTNADVMYFGNGKAETYDMAIKINNPNLVGKKVKSVSVALFEDATVSNPQGWLSSELLLDSKKKNAPDIAVIEAEVSSGNVLTATFSEPYEIPEEGVYVGYSITIAKPLTFGDNNPNPVATCVNQDGAYIHSTRTNLKWTSLSQYDVASCMEVVVEGEFDDYSVSVIDVGTVRTDGLPNSVEIPVKICNMGATEINSLEFTYIFDDIEPMRSEIILTDPVSAKFCTERKLSFPVPSYGKSSSLKVAVTKVNGEVNSLADSFATGNYVFMSFVPVLRPLMEEYTGLWCGWCPRGFVAMELMSEEYPDDFVCVSYHSGDVLEYIPNFPNEPDGFPSSFMNRAVAADPYFGVGQSGFGIKDLWLDLKTQDCPADINVELAWDGDDYSKLVCRSNVRFVSDENGDDYRVQYVLVGDGFKTKYVYLEDGSVNNKESLVLRQSNYYKGSAPYDDSPLWLPFINGDSNVTDLVFNDVAMSLADPIVALPHEVKADEIYEHEFEIDYKQVGSLMLSGENIIPDTGSLRCVAILLTADGKFVNCNKSRYVGLSSVKEVTSGTDVISTEWFDLQGRRLTSPDEGMNIRIDHLSNGSSRVVKSIKK